MSASPNSVKTKESPIIIIMEAAILLLLVAFLGLIIFRHINAVPASESSTVIESLPPIQNGGETPPASTTEPAPTPTPTPTPTPEPTPTPIPEFEPYFTEETDPENFIETVGISVNGETLGEDETYEALYPIDFTYGEDYTSAEGVITFRSNSFRDGGAYGVAELRNYEFGDSWYKTTGTLVHDGAVWTGSGWTGQPLIVKWPAETKTVMNMYDWAKEDDELVEVIYATMDGNIYFLDLRTGEPTRDKLNVGYCFKGAGALDPRGYPILYVGAGYDSDYGISRAFVISLIDFEIMYEFGRMDPFSLRGELCYFDSSALVDAETDQLIYPGENGILYIIKLNTEYDPEAGTISIDPDNVVKWHYYGERTSLMSYWVGIEGSAAVWRGHIFMCDNGGNLMCLDLNTLELKWVQNVLDDTNVTPVLSLENGHPYLYLGTSFHLGWRSWTTADVPIWKIDALTGEIVWKVEYNCYSESGVSGGVQSTVALGKNDLEGYVYVTVAKTDINSNGILACINRETGEVVWEHKSYYTWSSPVLVYNSDGSGVLVYCTYGNYMYMMDALTGEVLDSFNLQGGVEATPAVYENYIVVGTRQCKIWGIEMT